MNAGLNDEASLLGGRLIFVRSGPPRGPEEVAAQVARVAIDKLSQPSFRAGIVSMAAIGAICKRAGMAPIPTMCMMMLAAKATERLWEMAEDVHETAVAQRDHLAKLATDG